MKKITNKAHTGRGREIKWEIPIISVAMKTFKVLEHFHQCCSDALEALIGSGVFGFWLRFGSVTGFFKPAPSPKPRQKPKTLAPHRYISEAGVSSRRNG